MIDQVAKKPNRYDWAFCLVAKQRHADLCLLAKGSESQAMVNEPLWSTRDQTATALPSLTLTVLYGEFSIKTIQRDWYKCFWRAVPTQTEAAKNPYPSRVIK